MIKANEPHGGAPLLGLLLDIGLALVGYYALHAAGVSEWAALLAATAAAGVRMIWVAVRRRRFTWFGTMMLAVFGGSLALAFVGGDARLLLVKDSAGTATLGIVFLASLLSNRPLPLSAAETWGPERARLLTSLYTDDPAARRAVRDTTLGWGAGLLVESVARIPIVLTVPIGWAVGLSTAWMITALTALAIWNACSIILAARRTPSLQALLPGSWSPTSPQAAVPDSHSTDS